MGEAIEQSVRSLEEAYGQSFFLVDTATGETHSVGPGCLMFDVHSRMAICDQVARRGRPEVIEDFAPLLALAVPLFEEEETATFVAVSTFLTAEITNEHELSNAARALGALPQQVLSWARLREVWNPRAIQALAKALVNNVRRQAQLDAQKRQLSDVSSHLLSTFEELGMLHRLTERLTIASSEAELTETAIRWLSDVVPADCIAAVRYLEQDEHAQEIGEPQAETATFGACPIEEDDFHQLVEQLGPDAAHQCVVLNRDVTQAPDWRYPSIHELISVPIRSGERVLGWAFAFNHNGGGTRQREFTVVEASLLSSVAAILGVHAGNCRLFQEQKEFFSAMVKALSSAIDAKDPYTYGHSDRVARLSVCLARELGSEGEELNTIYLAGLLHDIGKIGIEDIVLRKEGKLTDAEYEHVKTHPELGYKILRGVRQLEHVLPVVLHHHESWDGHGYPSGLTGEECPQLARIVAVADAIDAMGSDRPYRAGMSDEQLNIILRDGAGKQWDAAVIDAVFRARDQVREIGRTDREPLALDVREWDA